MWKCKKTYKCPHWARSWEGFETNFKIHFCKLQTNRKFACFSYEKRGSYIEQTTLYRYFKILIYIFGRLFFFLGATVLNLAKVIMYDFHYNYIMKKFPTARLLFTDTDSLCYHIETEKDLYDEIKVRLRFLLQKLKLSFRIHNIWISLIIDLIMLTTIKINISFQGTSRMSMVCFFHLITILYSI